ncbi:MAG TPA: hypothetical protein VFE61_25420 [Candidatus Sulfotelmatobacter sp.]|nr:hypothetical protein [Candidatus Sulfotelmatobacter sp.]
MKGFVACALLAVFGVVWAQSAAGNHPVPSRPALKTFTSPDGVFQFEYPALLIHCKPQPQGEGEADNWTADACAAYIPVCSYRADPNFVTIVCSAYPRNRHRHTCV